jgi:hypothetical protein
MDNLFNSRKLYTAAYQVGCLSQGVTRTYGRGIPDQCIQRTETDVNKANRLRGKTIAAVLKDDDKCPDLLCVSLYDTKPVHLLSTVAETIDWTTKTRKVWSTAHWKEVMMQYLRLNLINDYNNNMNSVDLADQLRNCYRMNHWMRNRKWWWAIMLWGIGTAATNGYIIYDRSYKEEKKKGGIMPPKLSHLDFLVELSKDFIGLVDEEPESEATSAVSVSTTRRGSSYSVSSAAVSMPSLPNMLYDITTAEGREEWFANNKTSNITEKRMGNNYFSDRFDGRFHPSIPKIADADYCQYCRYKYSHMCNIQDRGMNNWMHNNRAKVSRCLVCNVNLCWACNLEWHGHSLHTIIQCLIEGQGRRLEHGLCVFFLVVYVYFVSALSLIS